MKKTTFFLLIFSVYCLSGSAQICDGNLGENIFPLGNFGSGTDNILQTNPEIAPGYIYDTNMPPEDGSYVISSDMNLWSAIFGWLRITDNSSDPNGYMMVVNGSFEPGLFFEQEVNNLCENTLYEFSVDIFNLKPNGSNSVQPNLSFLLNNTEVYSSGDVPENEEWNLYGFTFVTDPGQTSIVLSLRNNAPGGSGNDFAMDNINFRPCGPDALILPEGSDYICEDENPIILSASLTGGQFTTPVYQWQQSFDTGLTWEDIPGANSETYEHTEFVGGMYYYRFLSANAPTSLLNPQCRINSDLRVINFIPRFYDFTDTICAGLNFILGDNLLTETGMYTESFLSINGCDSIVRVDLTVVEDNEIIAEFSTAGLDCEEEDNGIIEINAIENGTGPYSILMNGAAAEFGNSITDLVEGTYNFTIEDTYGCVLDTIINLEKLEPLTVDLGEDRLIMLGEEVHILPVFSSTNAIYTWTPADLTDCETDCEMINLLPKQSTKISLSITSISGCVATDSICIELIKTRKIYFPNAFSPNLDGINDFFTVYGSVPNLEIIESMMIFDRWGNQVYKQSEFLPNDISAGWDGTFRGEEASIGIYAYVVQARFLDGETIVYKGDVWLTD